MRADEVESTHTRVNQCNALLTKVTVASAMLKALRESQSKLNKGVRGSQGCKGFYNFRSNGQGCLLAPCHKPRGDKG